jgi:hypothetical protein
MMGSRPIAPRSDRTLREWFVRTPNRSANRNERVQHDTRSHARSARRRAERLEHPSCHSALRRCPRSIAKNTRKCALTAMRAGGSAPVSIHTPCRDETGGSPALQWGETTARARSTSLRGRRLTDCQYDLPIPSSPRGLSLATSSLFHPPREASRATCARAWSTQRAHVLPCHPHGSPRARRRPVLVRRGEICASRRRTCPLRLPRAPYRCGLSFRIRELA